MEKVETAVIGGGMAGLPVALRAARYGPALLVEKELLGGTCLNRGCIPTKTMIRSAKVAHLVRTAGEYGVRAKAEGVDLAEVIARKDRVVETVRSGSYRAVEKREELTFVEGEAEILGPNRLRAGDREFQAGRIVVNTGARSLIPPIEGLDEAGYLTNRSMMTLTELPESLVVIGGGYVGCEFAQMFARFGSRVTVLQRGDRLLPAEEPDVSEVVLEAFEAEGIRVVLGAEATRVSVRDGTRAVAYRRNGADEEAEGTGVLVAAGRRPNTDGLGLEGAEVELDDGGYVRVDKRLRTSRPGVWAIGDVTGPPMFTHTARDDAEVLYRSVFKGEEGASVADRIVPHGVFTDPEVGAVGMTEAEAEAAGYEVSVGRQEFRGVGKALAMGETRGLVKIVSDRKTGRVLGCHIVGPEAANLVHEVVVAMKAGAPAQTIADAIHIHPTLAEGVNSAAGGVHRPSVA